jgi:FAD/FMN-containing dehydrogenase
VARLSSWGGVPVVEGHELIGENLERCSESASLSRGLARSLGDASLPAAPGLSILSTRLGDLILEFDPENGRLLAEAGFSLRALNRVFWPRGWASPVYPGTQDVTLGGMVASDVHGKNHHVVGSFGNHVHSLRMRLPSGKVEKITPESHPALFDATIGGLGLTGHVLEVEFSLERISSPFIRAETEPAGDLTELLALLRAASSDWPFTVAWVDSSAPARRFGRGVVIRGRWAEPGAVQRRPRELRLSVPFRLPDWFLQSWSVRIFNRLYYWLNSRSSGSRLVDPARFFFPLDAIGHWYRLYGKKGYVQYQCVVTHERAEQTFRSLLGALRDHGAASPISVIKDCGPASRGMLSFAMSGLSLALDFPMNGSATRLLFRRLNEIVIEGGGRIYLSKDALSSAEQIRAMDPRIERFCAFREQIDPDRRINSALAERLLPGRS